MKVLDNYYINVIKELTTFINGIEKNFLIEATELILSQEIKGKRLHITGIGKPSYVAAYSASLLSSTGTSAYFLDATEAIHGSSGQVKEGDVVIAISNSGETEELKKTIETLINNKARIVSVTSSHSSWLSNHSEITLIAKVNHEGDTLNKPPRLSILSEMIVLQGLSILLQEKKQLDNKQYIKWHPGGSLGKSTEQ